MNAQWPRRLRSPVGFLIIVATGGAVFAAGQDESLRAAVQVAPEVVVSATRSATREFDLPVSVDAVDKAAIREGNAQINLSETLNRIPGIQVQNRQNYAQDLQISSRGFGSRSSFGVRGIRLIADGIPATMPDGQGQAATFNLGSAERIEVMRGPFSSLYGNASGGVVQIFTEDGPTQPTLQPSLVLGSYGTRKAAINFGGQSGALNYIVDVSRFDTSGYRDHSAATRDHLNAKFKYGFGANTTLTVVANALTQPDTQDPLGLTRALLTANPRQADPVAYVSNTRKSIRNEQVGAVLEHRLAGGDRIFATAYVGSRDVTQFLAITPTVSAAATHSGGVVGLDRGFGGLNLRYVGLATLAGAPMTLTAGVDHDRMKERRRGFVNNFGIAGALKRDEDNTVSSANVYAQAEWAVLPRWNLSAGVRHNRVAFDSVDYFIVPLNGNDSGAVSYTHASPVAGALFKLSSDVHLYANAGRGFETPTFAELAYRAGGTGLNFGLQPATSDNIELGVKANRGSHRIRVAAFRIETRNEIVVDTNAGGRTIFKNASKTARYGFELSWEALLPQGFEAYAAVTLLDARFKDSFLSGTPARTVAAGNRIPGVASNSLYGELVWRHEPSGFSSGVELRRNSSVTVDDFGTDSAAGYAVLNWRAQLQQKARNLRFTEFLRIDNLTDRDYVGSVIVAEGNARFFEPAPRRQVLLGVNASIGF